MEIWVRACLSVGIFVAAVLASAAGTGGGALYIPGYVVALKDVHKAVPLSKVTIFGACLVSVLFNLGRRQPAGELPLISYELAAILEPCTLLGGILGVLLNIVMTDVQIIVCLVLILSFTTYKTTRKGLAQYREENRIISERHIHTEALLPTASKSFVFGARKDGEEETAALLAEQPPARVHSVAEFIETPSVLLESSPPVQSAKLEADSKLLRGLSAVETAELIRERSEVLESRRHPSWPSLLYLVFAALVNIACLLAAGGPIAIACGEPWQQGCIYFLISFHVLATAMYGRWLLQTKRFREQIGIEVTPVEHGGLGWVSPRTVVFYPFLSLIAGIAAGSLGIGGGLIKGPLLLEIGLNSLSAVTTANFMIFFTSSANVLQYATLGRLNWADSLNFFLVAATAGAVGLICVTRALKRTRRQSYLTLLLSFITFVSMLCMLFSFVWSHFYNTSLQKPLTVEDACKERHRLLFVHSS